MAIESRIQFQRLYKNTEKTISFREAFMCSETPTKKFHQPSVDYQLAENEDGLIEKAFDILFEETLRQNSDLTTNDN